MTVYFQLGSSFGMLASDTPTNDQNSVSFITPSPVVGEGHAPKAPMKKVWTIFTPTDGDILQYCRVDPVSLSKMS